MVVAGLIRSGQMNKLDTYTRDDRGSLQTTYDGLSDLLGWADAMLVMEKYGLSLIFCDEEIEWLVSDPKNIYKARANTPAGAIIMWDLKRQDVEGKDDKPKLKLVTSD